MKEEGRTITQHSQDAKPISPSYYYEKLFFQRRKGAPSSKKLDSSTPGLAKTLLSLAGEGGDRVGATGDGITAAGDPPN